MIASVEVRVFANLSKIKMKYYPLYVNIEDKPCIVIGGGEVGERKVLRLLECGARVTVVSKAVTPALQILQDENRIHCIRAEYEPGQVTGAFLVIGATDQDAVNKKISADCRQEGIMVNIVDDPICCDFILPSLCERGDLSIAVSTGGKSPALAKKIRQDLEKTYGAEYAVLLKIMGHLRERIVAVGRPSDENRDIFEALLQSPILEEISQERWDRVKRIIRDIAGVDMDPGEEE
jgi:precorrin-2 dehydrogenase/sirohydrochlorin ferrochelatase